MPITKLLMPSVVETVTDTAGMTVQDTLYSYDDLAFDSVTTGNVTQAEGLDFQLRLCNNLLHLRRLRKRAYADRSIGQHDNDRLRFL